MTAAALDGEPINYENLKALGEAINRPLGTLIALNDDNDRSSRTDQDAAEHGAEWFRGFVEIVWKCLPASIRRLIPLVSTSMTFQWRGYDEPCTESGRPSGLRPDAARSRLDTGRAHP